MTIDPSTIYWIGQCDCIREVCAAIILVGSIAALFAIPLTIASFVEVHVPRVVSWVGVVFSSIILAVVSFAIVGELFVPTSKTVASMYVIPAIVNNEKIQDAGNQLYDLAVSWMEELRPASKKKGGAK